MKNIRLSIIPPALLLALGVSVAQAEPVGRVLVAMGDTTALRSGIEVKLVRGAEVQSGDILRVGEASNMQVRFTDAGITALRSNSSLRIDDYQFEEKTNVGKSLFSLLKGGMRAITGLIGLHNRDNYAVKAATATIGIRGTNFLLAQCDNDCFNKDGSQAENGLFGGVTDGRIAVNNQAGEKEFGKNEFFHVPSSDAAPKPLLAPPSFLRDQLEGQAKSKEGKAVVAKAAAGETENGGNGDAESGDKGSSAGEGSETATGSQTGTAVSTQPTGGTVTTVQVAVDTSYTPTEQTVVQTSVSGGVINTGLAAGQTFNYLHAFVGANASVHTYSDGTSSFSFPHSFSEASVEQGVLTIIDPTKLAQKQDAFFAQLVSSQTPVLTFLTNAFSVSATSDYYSSYDEFGNPIGAPAGTVNFSWAKTAATNTGSAASAGNLSWGRHTETEQATVVSGLDVGATFGDTRNEHWATGDPVNFAGLPTSGIYTYSWVGGTNPTDQYGNVGTMTSGGTVMVAFAGQSGANISLSGAAWTMPSGSSYSLSFSNQQVNLAETYPYSLTTPGWTDTGTNTRMTQIVTTAGCTGAGCPGTTVNATVSGMLFGANAEGLAAGISTQPIDVGTGEYTASVQAYQHTGTTPIVP